ncbi:MAG: hypothetical protein WD824_04055 [Cyclobacteriaceae bacterium]
MFVPIFALIKLVFVMIEKVNIRRKLDLFPDHWNPKIEHRPVAEKEVEILLFEPATTLNTGNLVNERTKKELKRI